jgi:hypothetical protein
MADYRNAKTYKSSSEAEKAKKGLIAQYGDIRWWDLKDEDERNKSLMTMATALEDASAERQQANLRHARLYENVELDSLTGTDYAAALVRQALYGAGVMRLNVIAACEDTLAAKITKNRPRPNFLTSGASWKSQQKARRLDKWMRGVFYETQVHEKSKPVAMDGFTFGTGFLHVYMNAKKRIECERVIPDEVFIDDTDGMYGKPRVLLRKKRIQREVLVAMFPKKAQDIYEADPPEGEPGIKDARTPSVDVWEAWHLPSAEGAGDGLHIIAIDGCELACDPWELDCFPFIPFRFKDRTLGYWGKGIAESLVGIQVELNRLILSISEQLRRKGKSRVFVQMGSKVNPNHLTNGIGDIVYYTGQPPVVDNSNVVSPEEFMQVDRLYQKAFQEVGISELSAAAKKPSGLDAAVALREYSDIESERFALVHQKWEQFFLDFASLCIEMVSTFSADGYKTKMPGRRTTTEIDWQDIQLAKDAYVMQMFPVSSLPQTPSARYAKVKEMQQDGMISKPVAQRLLEFPDIEAEMNLGNAAIDDVDATISKILDDAKPELEPVEPFQNIDLLIERATASYLFAKHFPDIEEERLSMLRTLISSASQTKANLMAPPAPPPGAMGPPGMGAPPPPMPGPMPMPGANVGNVNINASPPVAPLTPPVVA